MRPKLLSLFLAGFSSIAFAGTNIGNTMQVERYSTVNESATAAQINPLLSVASFRFPQSVGTVGDAVDIVLRYSGYELAPADTLPLQLVTVLSKPLPMVDRTLGPLTTQDALLVLVGKGLFSLNQDPIQRTVNFHYLGKVPPESKTKAKKTTFSDAQLNKLDELAWFAWRKSLAKEWSTIEMSQKELDEEVDEDLNLNQSSPASTKTGA